MSYISLSLDVIEDFHSRLHTIRYLQDGIHLYIEPSANEGATGYLSLEGHVLDFEGIQDYLSDHHLKGEDALQFLTALEKGIGKTWEKATRHYDQVLETVVAEYQLKEKALEKTQEHEKKLRVQSIYHQIDLLLNLLIGAILVRVLYNKKLKAVPHPYQQMIPLDDLLPVVLRSPTFLFILLQIMKRYKQIIVNIG